MNIVQTGIPGLVVIEPRVFKDDRGYFFETFHKERYREAGIIKPFIQDNESRSTKGVVRGLHYQLGDAAQAKLVRVVQGAVYDVAVDLRKGSPTFGKWFGVQLDENNKKQLYVPRGFAHGFSVLSDTAIFTYKCDNLYNPATERSINPFDKTIGINWLLGESEKIVSEKDLAAPVFADAEMNFVYEQ
ncbi:dTDP-4-dehydrorhamnose 3,5-epimerase [Draconibacterium sp. IB214405]|uniref:dTDP-4-dehydrorhamnose 3,5-epimerase n=1 Tax=Draconibacterium sp. IB214405 TaxID=3097352 RepID=UPI002A116599|nr:dTDP-4-dehydrorhamnose 3,5-epimerase [Draconibacterium sp. IB214405]MDX8339170.1 dTDP-4-dehydrorhamnose 3,5-epimerase [Draconibacterium sp. IB214405]